MQLTLFHPSSLIIPDAAKKGHGEKGRSGGTTQKDEAVSPPTGTAQQLPPARALS